MTLSFQALGFTTAFESLIYEKDSSDLSGKDQSSDLEAAAPTFLAVWAITEDGVVNLNHSVIGVTIFE